MKQNLAESHEEADNASWGSFIKTSKRDYLSAVRYSSRLVYILFLKGIDDWQKNSTQVNVTSSRPPLVQNSNDDPFISLFRFLNNADPEYRRQLLEQYLSEKREQLHKNAVDNIYDKHSKDGFNHPFVMQSEQQ